VHLPAIDLDETTKPFYTDPVTSGTPRQKLTTWHHRLGHRNVKDIFRMVNSDLTQALSLEEKNIDFCEACVTGKAKASPYPKTSKLNKWDLLERIDVDECGPLPIVSLNGKDTLSVFPTEKASSSSPTSCIERVMPYLDSRNSEEDWRKQQGGPLDASLEIMLENS
jgi:hypothetical protein